MTAVEGGGCSSGWDIHARAGRRAVVIGASISGLLAARVLADHYETVTVVDRDVLRQGLRNRRGVPQGSHSHLMLSRCSRIMGELFPGFLNDLLTDGVPAWADGDLSKLDVSFAGRAMVRTGKLRDPAANAQYYPSRPFLEFCVRQRVWALPNVTILDGFDAADVISPDGGHRVVGVRLTNRDGRGEMTLTADLVVDAAGRASRAPVFLEKLGYGRPPVDEVVVRTTYASQVLRIPHGTLDKKVISRAPGPGQPVGFVLLGNEDNTWMLTLIGIAGHEPPAGRPEILRFLEQIAPADVVDAVRAAQPVGETTHYRVPSSRWRRYDKMRRLPDGFVVVGDAICSFNPIYGQGMTVAALDAIVLGECLQRGRRRLPRRFFRASAKNIAPAWRMAVGADLALPEVAGSRSALTRSANAYMERVMIAAHTDPAVAEQFLRVIGMIDPPARLLRPAMMLRIARATSRHDRHRGPVATQTVQSSARNG